MVGRPGHVSLRWARAQLPDGPGPDQARTHLAELVSRARRRRGPVVLTEHRAPAAAIISMDELDELRQPQDAADLALFEAIRARSGPGMPHEEFMALVDVNVHLPPNCWLLGRPHGGCCPAGARCASDDDRCRAGA